MDEQSPRPERSSSEATPEVDLAQEYEATYQSVAELAQQPQDWGSPVFAHLEEARDGMPEVASVTQLWHTNASRGSYTYLLSAGRLKVVLQDEARETDEVQPTSDDPQEQAQQLRNLKLMVDNRLAAQKEKRTPPKQERVGLGARALKALGFKR
jgi:hypothetical protein